MTKHGEVFPDLSDAFFRESSLGTTALRDRCAGIELDRYKMPMPIYHFNVKRISTSFTDHDGIVFDNMNDAWEEATIAAGEMVKDLDGELVPGTSCSIEVQDEFYNTLRTVHITVSGPKR